MRDDCFLLDPHWLIDRHPELWEQMVTLDDQLTALEQQGAAEQEYRHAIDRLCQAVQHVRVLDEQEALPFPCPCCSGPVHREPPDEHAPTRFWTCSRCGTWGATREGATAPAIWISSGGVQ